MLGQRLALVGLMLLSAAMSLSCAATPQSAEPLRLPLTMIRSNPVTMITVGSRTVQAGIDTGGGGITLSEETIRNAGGVKLADERVWTDAFGHEFRVPQFEIPVMEIGGRAFRDVVVTQATDMPEGEGPPVPNVIGRQFIGRYFAVIDYAGLLITLWPADSEGAASAACGTVRIPMEHTEESELAVSEFHTPSGALRLLWDTGASYSVLPEELAANRRLETNARGQTPFYSPTELSAAGHEFEPLEFVVLPVRLPDDFQGLLGANFFSDHVVCLDYEKREVRVR